MLDKILYINSREVRLYFTHRPIATLYSSKGDILTLLNEFLAPLSSQCDTLSQYLRVVATSQDDTPVIPFNSAS